MRRAETTRVAPSVSPVQSSVPDVIMSWPATVFVAAFSTVYLTFGLCAAIAAAPLYLLLYIVLFYRRYFHIVYRVGRRDIISIWHFIHLKLAVNKFHSRKWTVNEALHSQVEKHPNKSFILFEDEVWTFKNVEDYSLRVSAAIKAEGFQKGDTIAIMMNNCPQLPATWIGIAHMGGVSSLINVNQRGNSLLHSITIVNSKALIFSEDFLPVIQNISSKLDPATKLYMFTHRKLNLENPKPKHYEPIPEFTTILENVEAQQWTKPGETGISDKILYIYTSGTTGLPKAAVLSHSKAIHYAAGIHCFGLNSSDVIYTPLPLYHTAGGVVCIGQGIYFGCTVAIRSKFSASQFFPDCIKFKATVGQYIGEMCRYVLSAPPAASDTQHRVRAMFGNGLRPRIWTPFVERFNIKNIIEFYGSTEGNKSLINTDGRVGAVGFKILLIKFDWAYPVDLIKVDDQGHPIRGSDGLCQIAGINEPGIFVGELDLSSSSEFLGYSDNKETEKKILRDVFKKGDAAYYSGDVLVMDEWGYFYFKDRTGETFRWHGENVSTTEVENIMSPVAGHRDVAVYGVEVPNTEGRAGMCAIQDVIGNLDLDKMVKNMSDDLPSYARPVFLRIQGNMELTGTFKIQKGNLQKQGFDPSLMKEDKLYYLDSKLGKYLPLGPEEYRKINNGDIRL